MYIFCLDALTNDDSNYSMSNNDESLDAKLNSSFVKLYRMSLSDIKSPNDNHGKYLLFKLFMTLQFGSSICLSIFLILNIIF